jgi:hypothetical protein
MWTLCRFTVPLRWNGASSLKIRHGRKVSSPMFLSIWSQNMTRFTLSFVRRAWTSCRRYGLNSKWCLSTCQTVVVFQVLCSLYRLTCLGYAQKYLEFASHSTLLHAVGLSFCPYTDNLFAQIDNSSDKCSSLLEVQCWNDEEMHPAPQSLTRF